MIGRGGETTHPCLQVLGGQALHVRVDDLTEARGAAVEVCDDARALLGRRKERLLIGELRVPAQHHRTRTAESQPRGHGL